MSSGRRGPSGVAPGAGRRRRHPGADWGHRSARGMRKAFRVVSRKNRAGPYAGVGPCAVRPLKHGKEECKAQQMKAG
jgi:hypothetical protein